jgi:hypothetical protein
MTLTPVLINFDRESFNALKELLRQNSHISNSLTLTHGARVKSEALKRVFDQIRDLQYGSESRPVSLDHE